MDIFDGVVVLDGGRDREGGRGASAGELENILLSPFALKKFRKQPATLLLHHPTNNLRPMVQLGMPEEISNASRHSCLGVVGTKNHPGHPRQHDGTGTLRARLEGDAECRGVEPIDLQDLYRRSNGDHLGVLCEVPTRYRLVVRNDDHSLVYHDGGANGNFIQLESMAGRPKGGRHTGPVVVGQ